MILRDEEFCELLQKVNSKAAEIYKVLENVQKEIGELKIAEGRT